MILCALCVDFNFAFYSGEIGAVNRNINSFFYLNFWVFIPGMNNYPFHIPYGGFRPHYGILYYFFVIPMCGFDYFKY